MQLENMILEKSNQVAKVILNRPKAFNSFDLALGNDFVRALEFCSNDNDTRAVIVTGAGKAFCAGGDIGYFRTNFEPDPSEPFRQIIKALNSAIMNIRRMPKPVIAAINGAAGGAGFSLATACDLRIIAASAKMRTAYTGIGMVGDGGWTLTVPLLVGFGRAMELMFLDPVLDARKALEWGLVNMVVNDNELEKSAMELAQRLAAGPTKAYAIAKENLNNAMQLLLERQLELERTGMINAAYSSDYEEGMKAFMEKRKPVFTGH